MPEDTSALSSGRASVGLLILIALAPILAAYAIMLRLMVNIPHIDDYPLVLGFSLRYMQLPTWQQRLALIFNEQYREYKFIVMHAVVAVQLGLTHHIDFRLLGFAGNLLLLPLLWLLWKTYFQQEQDRTRRLLLFLPIVFILFTLNYGEGLDWASSTLDYLPSIVFSLAAIHFLCRPGWVAFLLASLCTVASCFSAVNGVLLLPIGFGILLWRRRILQAGLWIVPAALSVLPYLTHYVVYGTEGRHSARLAVPFFVLLVGAGAPMYKLALPMGILILLAFVLAIRSAFFKTHTAAVMAALWLLLSDVLIAIGRSYAGLDFAHVSRYKFFSDLLIVFCYAVAVDRVSASKIHPRTQQRLYAAALLFTVAACLIGDHAGYVMLSKRRVLVRDGLASFRQNPDVNTPLWWGNLEAQRQYVSEETAARVYTQQAIQTGLYSPPPTP